jgi:hypothetical protein
MIDKYIVNGNGQVPKMQPVSHVVAPLEASSDIGKGSEPSVLKVIIGILIEPGETFRSVAGRASWTALVPLVLFLVLATVEAITLVHRVDMNASARQQILRSSHASKLSPEQIDKMVEIGVKMGRFQAYIAPVTYTLSFLLIAVIFWLVILAFGNSLSFADAFRVVCWSIVPKIIVTALFILVLFIGNPTFLDPTNALTISLGDIFSFEQLGRPLFTFLSDLDVITLWTLCLYSVGFAAFANTRVAKIAAIVFGLFCFYVLGHVGLVAIS